MHTSEHKQPTRRAIVTGGLNADLETVRAYLPSNYYAEQTERGIVIEGTDNHGWTLDGYVLPRLQSGLIAARELILDGLSRERCRTCDSTVSRGQCDGECGHNAHA